MDHAPHHPALARTTVTTFALAIAVAAPRAQDVAPPRPDAATLQRQLASKDPIEVAWAAFHARERRDARLVAPLARTLANWRDGKHEERAVVCFVLLDALVALDAKLPGSELLPLADDRYCLGPTLALLLRESKANEADLLALFRRDWRGAVLEQHEQPVLRSHAIGNVLAAQRTPGFAAAIARHLDVDLHVQTGLPIYRKGIDRDGPRFLPAGYPRVNGYQLVRGDRVKDVPVLSPGPRRIGLRRGTGWLVTPGQPGPGFDGFAWLQTMAGADAPPERELRVPVPEPPDWQQQVAKAQRDLQRYVDALREQLVGNGSMTREEAKLLERQVTVRAHAHHAERSGPSWFAPPR